ncbi:MAG: NAD(P)H-dependent glycerol-3-phosphate dehydrogenase [Gammaproteobacteria bacterium]
MAGAAPVGILGAGSWGTALALQLTRNGHPVRLWSPFAEELAPLARERQNRRYLPGFAFPETLQIETDLSVALAGVHDVLVAVPSGGFRDTVTHLAVYSRQGLRLAWATKGFEPGSAQLLHQVAARVLGAEVPLAVVSGPSFAREVAAGLPTAVTLASEDAHFSKDFAARLHGPSFRVYSSEDVIGVEVGGAVKNVIAIACGLSDGLKFGANARAALITRGLAEISRLGVRLGAQAQTFQGLSGVGDLVLTCTDDQSRNRRLGLALGAGRTLAPAQAAIGQVVEGVMAAAAARQLAQNLGVDMPITEQVYRILHEQLLPRAAVEALMARESTAET